MDHSGLGAVISNYESPKSLSEPHHAASVSTSTQCFLDECGLSRMSAAVLEKQNYAWKASLSLYQAPLFPFRSTLGVD